MIALIAAEVADNTVTDALDQVNVWWATVGGLVPFLVARITNPEARSIVKFAIALGMSVAAALIVIAPQVDWSMLTPEAAFLWVAAFIGVVQTVYGAVKSGNRFFTNEETGLNETGLAGAGGIGPSFNG